MKNHLIRSERAGYRRHWKKRGIPKHSIKVSQKLLKGSKIVNDTGKELTAEIRVNLEV